MTRLVMNGIRANILAVMWPIKQSCLRGQTERSTKDTRGKDSRLFSETVIPSASFSRAGALSWPWFTHTVEGDCDTGVDKVWGEPQYVADARPRGVKAKMSELYGEWNWNKWICVGSAKFHEGGSRLKSIQALDSCLATLCPLDPRGLQRRQPVMESGDSGEQFGRNPKTKVLPT
ncbi:hypothetical protein K438DRAFT_1752747 [Mycena galopus ATCC 62051]|nr:hypothetical protein K438DRAFT_1752747 [Mycena galopus ATCC 62051]